MTQPNVPDRPQDGVPAEQPDAGASPVDHAAPIRPPAAVPPPSPPPLPLPLPPPGDHAAGGPGGGGATSPGRAQSAGPAGHGVRPEAARPPQITRQSVIARLALVLPLLVGVLLVEGLFANQGRTGDVVSLPAAGLALVLMWMGVAWALRSWAVLLMTFVPAIMVTLGTAMVGSLAPGAGAALLLVGVALIGAVISFRLSAPAHRWNPGWAPAPRTPPWPPAGPPFGPAAGGAAGHDAPPGGGAVSGIGASPQPPTWPLRPLDPLGAHVLSPGSGDDHEPPRPAPAWDTSRTDRGARDRLVAALCRRGGTTGPTLATLEEYFTGNGDPRSIAPGLRGAIPLATFAAVLYRLRGDRSVSELLVQVEPLEAGSYPAGEWPAAGGLHLVSTLGADEIDARLAGLRPEASIGPMPADRLADGTPAPEGSCEYAIWWA